MAWITQLTVVDYILLGIMIGALLIGWIKGLVDILAGFLVFWIAMLISGRYANDIVNWLDRVWKVEQWLAELLEHRIHLPGDAYRIPLQSIPWDKAQEWLRDTPLSDAYREILAQRIALWSKTAGGQTVATYVTQQIAHGVLNVAVFLLLTLLVGWILSFLTRILSDQIKELPLIGTVNRLLGCLAYSLQTATVLALVISLAAPILSISGIEWLGLTVQRAQLYPYFLHYFVWVKELVFGGRSTGFFTS